MYKLHHRGELYKGLFYNNLEDAKASVENRVSEYQHKHSDTVHSFYWKRTKNKLRCYVNSTTLYGVSYTWCFDTIIALK